MPQRQSQVSAWGFGSLGTAADAAVLVVRAGPGSGLAAGWHPIVGLADRSAMPLLRRLDQSAEQGMGLAWPGEKFGVVLAGGKERVIS
jgi:hypothetical protein